MILKFEWANDEVCDVWLDGQLISEMNHDEHGWAGMVEISDLLHTAAKIAGWEIQIVGESGI